MSLHAGQSMSGACTDQRLTQAEQQDCQHQRRGLSMHEAGHFGLRVWPAYQGHLLSSTDHQELSSEGLGKSLAGFAQGA